MKKTTKKQHIGVIVTICSILMVCLPTDPAARRNAENPLVLTDGRYDYPIGGHLAFLEDASRTLTIYDVTAPPYAARFTPGSGELTNLGMDSNVYWIRIPIRNESRDIDHWRLRIEASYLDLIEIYLPGSVNREHSFTKKRSGDTVPFHEWDIAHRQFVFKIVLQPGTGQTVYVRIINADGFIARMSLSSAEAFAEEIAHEHLWYGIYFGSMLIMAGYNLFVFLLLRDKSYLYYVLFVMSWGLKEFSSEGFAYQYFWPGQPHWNEPISVLLGTLSAVFALLFTAQFLKLRSLNPAINRVVLILCAGWFVSFGSTWFTGLSVTSLFIHLLTLGSLAIIVIAPAVSWHRGYRPARYLLLAWAAFAITGTASILTTFNVLPPNTILLYSYPIGVVLLMLLLSWALADRINDLKTEAERKRLRALELQQAREVAEAENQAKSMFLANMSHELRTPLNAILGFTRVISRNRNLPTQEINHLGIIQRSGEHLLTLINQVLDLSKIETGRTHLNEDDVDLHRLLNDVHDMFVIRADNKSLYLNFNGLASVPRYVRTDDVKLREVLINLIGNAIKFTKTGGVDVSVKIKAAESMSQPPEFSLGFRIADTGPGIASEEMDKLFEAFGQTAAGRQAREGTGLGLAISRRFIQLMGGDIRVQSDGGRGTVFTFDIQTREVDAEDIILALPSRRVTGLESGQPLYRMLIVDDNRDNRHLLLELLHPFGFHLREAENGRKAVEIWKTWAPHLIWMDMRMPVLDGYESTKTIRTLEGEKPKSTKSETQSPTFGFQTRIIAVTASSFEEEQAVVMSAGCDDYLRKPFTDTEIFNLLHKHLGIRFEYEEEPRSAVNSERAVDMDALKPEALAAIPEEWVRVLEQAARRADFFQLTNIIGKIREQDETLADAVARLADEFEYDKILAMMQAADAPERK